LFIGDVVVVVVAVIVAVAFVVKFGGGGGRGIGGRVYKFTAAVTKLVVDGILCLYLFGIVSCLLTTQN
jgi:hypothetical protein